MTQPPRDKAEMDEIMASIRRIVAEQDDKLARSALAKIGGEVLVLTPEMRIDAPAQAAAAAAPSGDAPAPQAAPSENLPQPAPEPAPEAPNIAAAPAPEAAGTARPDLVDPSELGEDAVALSVDEAAIVEISRAVLLDEVENGALAQRLREIIREEIAAQRS